MEERLKRIEALEEGWDGDCAQPANKVVLVKVKEALSVIFFPNPEVGAVEDGSMDLNWVDKGIYCTFVEDSGVVDVYHVPSGYSTRVRYDTVDFADKFKEVICAFEDDGFKKWLATRI